MEFVTVDPVIYVDSSQDFKIVPNSFLSRRVYHIIPKLIPFLC